MMTNKIDMTKVTFSVITEDFDDFETFTISQDMSKSAIVRKIIEDYVEFALVTNMILPNNNMTKPATVSGFSVKVDTYIYGLFKALAKQSGHSMISLMRELIHIYKDCRVGIVDNYLLYLHSKKLLDVASRQTKCKKIINLKEK